MHSFKLLQLDTARGKRFMWARLDYPHAYLWKVEVIEEYHFMIKIHTGARVGKAFCKKKKALNLCGRRFLSLFVCFIILHGSLQYMQRISSQQQN